MWLILPKLVRTFQRRLNTTAIRKQAIDTIAKISRQTNISDYTGLLMHNLTIVLGDPERVLKQAAYDCICALIFQFGPDFVPFIDGVKMSLVANNITHPTFDTLATTATESKSREHIRCNG